MSFGWVNNFVLKLTWIALGETSSDFPKGFELEICLVTELMYSRMILMVACLLYGMPFDANGCVSTLMNVDWIKWMYFCVKKFEVGVNISIFSCNEQQKV